ncbi:hypothetical protein L210DRAFT_3412961 [Boletus edulis BED1]|uniref:Transmembrane protein n=1 Tax=Boletus edulis BED1 TaxID=1328754 RepID=A0AAD4GAF7_BOLED|nr:hypothetical protein L210DRAFT_3412961 [Boletus edulis BED1]
MTSSTIVVHGNWRCASSSENFDLEAQTISGTHTPFTLPITPEPVRVAPTPTRTPHDTTVDAIDDFFGVSHAARSGEVPPPPYADTGLPVYSAAPNTEPITFAMYLFKFGFLFPPFWVLGVIILVSPLTAPADFEPSKSGTERQRLVAIIRDAELKWAKRCVWALVTLLALVGFAAAIALVVLRS